MATICSCGTLAEGLTGSGWLSTRTLSTGTLPGLDFCSIWYSTILQLVFSLLNAHALAYLIDHGVFETIPAGSVWYIYRKENPEELTAWYEAAEKDPPHKHYSRSDLSTPYWRIIGSHTVCPYHLIQRLIADDVSGVLRPPRNMNEIASSSEDFVEAYFPTYIKNQRRRQQQK